MASYNIVSLDIFNFRSGDATARIWTIGEGRCKSGSQNGPSNVLVLKHVRGSRTNERNKDVTTLDWNVSLIAYSDLNPRWVLIDISILPSSFLIFHIHFCLFQTHTNLPLTGKVFDEENFVMFFKSRFCTF